MRESLTVLAILLIVVLTTALVGPYFVDWNQHRGEIEARLSGLLGAKVAIAGPIDVKLLPRPIFQLQQVSITGHSPADGSVAAERVDMELALTALLRGEIQFIDADLTRPRISLTVAEDRSVVLPGLAGANPDKVSLTHVAIHDGTLAFVDGKGGTQASITGLEGEGQAESLAGPFKFSGHVDTPRGPLGFRAATGAYESRKMRLKATVDASDGIPKTEIEGIIATTAAGAGIASSLGFDGSVTATGEVPVGDAGAVVPWHLATRVQAAALHLEASQLEFRAGTEGRALVATGSGTYDAPASRADVAPSSKDGVLHLALRAHQLDIGKLVVPADASAQNSDPGATPSIPPALADTAALRSIAENADLFSGLPLPVGLEFGVETVTLGGQTFANLGGALTLAAGRPGAGSVSIEAGDGSRVKLDGSFEPGPAAVFKGRLDASSHDFDQFADGLTPDFPDLASWLKHTLPVHAFGFSGSMNLSGIGFAAHDVALDLDHSRFAGTLTLTRAVGTEPGRFFADLTSDALDLDALPDWRAAAGAVSDLDLSLTLAARAVRLARTDTGAVEAGRIALQLKKSGSAVTLDRLSLADFGGAAADLKGSSDGHAAHLEGRFDARRLRDLASLVQKIAPSPATELFAARADLLSPALLQVAVDASIDDDGSVMPRALSVDGTAAGTKVALHLRPDVAPLAPSDPLAPFRSGRQPFTASLLLDAAESGALLRQLGVSTLPTTAIGRGRIDASARLSSSGILDGTFTTTLGDISLTFKGRGSADAEVSGHAVLHGPNLAPVLRAILLANPEPGAIWPADAVTDLVWADRRIVTRNLTGRLIGSAFGGDLTLSLPSAPDPATLGLGAQTPPTLGGTLRLDRLPLAVLTGLALGPLPPPKPGTVWPNAAFGPGFLILPRTELGLTIGSFPLTDSVVGKDARLTLRLAPGVVTLADLSTSLGQGRLGGTWTLRRDGPAASLSGHIDWDGVPLATPSMAGRSRGALDLAGTGNSVAELVSSLAGSGTVGVDDARLPRFDPEAVTRVVAGTDAASGTVDDVEIGQNLARELEKGALSLGNVSAPVTVAAGVLRAGAVKVEGQAVNSESIALLDLKTLQVSLRTTATLRAPPKDWSGTPPQVGIIWKGPFLTPDRTIDSAALVNGIAARAIARDQARIEAFQDDIRERAFFARRLRAIEAEQQATQQAAQQAAREKARIDADAERLKAFLARNPGDTTPLKPAAPKTPDPVPSDAKPAPTVVKPPSDAARPPAAPLLQRSLVRPGKPKPIDLQHLAPVEAGAPPGAFADPGAAGRY